MWTSKRKSRARWQQLIAREHKPFAVAAHAFSFWACPACALALHHCAQLAHACAALEFLPGVRSREPWPESACARGVCTAPSFGLLPSPPSSEPWGAANIATAQTSKGEQTWQINSRRPLRFRAPDKGAGAEHTRPTRDMFHSCFERNRVHTSPHAHNHTYFRYERCPPFSFISP